jgi:DUF4097 and DUF4098 domain-containing protein YvlB
MFFAVVFIVFNLVSAYGGGIAQMNLVNEQKIALEQVKNIEILYRSETVGLFKTNTSSLIIKEYMSKDDRDYYADITNSETALSIKSGKRPFGLFNTFHARVEIYIPESNALEINIKATSGRIEAASEYICSRMALESSSGAISVNSITAEAISLKTTSGGINLGTINGSASIESTSGNIKVNQITGALLSTISSSSGSVRCEGIAGDADINTTSGSIVINRMDGDISTETTSGSIHASVTALAGNISMSTSSGSISLELPQSYSFNFLSETTSGGLSTPFTESLSSPVSDSKLSRGIIGGNTSGNKPDNNVDIRTTSGPINVKWVN